MPSVIASGTKSCPAAPATIRQSCWPNESETRLLQAGLCELPKALAVWRDFCGRIDDIKTLDHECYRLFPLVAANLQKSGETFQHRNRMLGVLRHASARNQVLAAGIAPILRTLQEAGVELLLLKGAALAQLYRDQGSVRPMVDIDILIHPEDLPKTVDILRERGFTCDLPLKSERLADLVRFRHELTMRSATGMELDIHWHLVADALNREVEDYFWRNAEACTLAGLTAETLNPTDQLLHTCLHGVQWNQISPVRWLADAAMLIRGGIDWSRLEAQARRLERLEPVRDTILFLEQLEVPLPAGVNAHWLQIDITPFEKVEGGYRITPPNSSKRTKQLTWIYLRLHRNESFGSLLRQAPAYMRQIHHFRAYSRRAAFIGHLIAFHLNKKARMRQPSS